MTTVRGGDTPNPSPHGSQRSGASNAPPHSQREGWPMTPNLPGEARPAPRSTHNVTPTRYERNTMTRTLIPDDELDRILLRMGREVAESDTILSAFLALHVAEKRGHGPGIRRALDDCRALLGLNRLPEADEQDAVIYRLCSGCKSLHPVTTSCTR